METFYLFLIIFLFVLAVFDLSVGVSNDAVNFMNSAIGSKAASFKVIMVIAAIGIFVGASLSNGMMDIARHGIYQPQHFYFSEIMCILLAVMLTDVVLLDIFNSLGMPTLFVDRLKVSCWFGVITIFCFAPSKRMEPSTRVAVISSDSASAFTLKCVPNTVIEAPFISTWKGLLGSFATSK